MDDKHFEAGAALVAALPPDDQERAAALKHAEACSDCRAALEEGESLQLLLRKAIAATVG